MDWTVRFERTRACAFRFAAGCLRPLGYVQNGGAERRFRTSDARAFNAPLYRLSYLGESGASDDDSNARPAACMAAATQRRHGCTRGGADDEPRTRDLDFGRVALCLLSYIRGIAGFAFGQCRGLPAPNCQRAITSRRHGRPVSGNEKGPDPCGIRASANRAVGRARLRARPSRIHKIRELRGVPVTTRRTSDLTTRCRRRHAGRVRERG